MMENNAELQESTHRQQELCQLPPDQVSLNASAWVLTECREFILRTFSYLTAKELNTCARVCRVWCKEAQRMLAGQRDMTWVSDSKLRHPLNDKSTHPLGFFGENLDDTLKMLRCQPKFVLMFTEYSKGSEYRACGFEGSSKSDNKAPNKSPEVMDYIKGLLPSDCCLLSLKTPGTVGPHTSKNTSPGDESESCGGTTCAIFPSMPGVDIKILPVSPKVLQGGDKASLWQMWLDAGISPCDTQCILLFGWGFTSGVQQAAMELQRLFQEKARRNPVIAGAIVNRMLTKGLCSKSQESSGVIGVTFSGSNVRAASVILNESVRTREEAKRSISRLKEAQLPCKPKHSLGLMFACSGRGLYFYGEQNVESEEFHRAFPDVPLIGLFGGGEIGCQNLSIGNVIDEECFPPIVHAYTTVFCLLSFNAS